jgi:hypothetical protein
MPSPLTITLKIFLERTNFQTISSPSGFIKASVAQGLFSISRHSGQFNGWKWPQLFADQYSGSFLVGISL